MAKKVILAMIIALSSLLVFFAAIDILIRHGIIRQNSDFDDNNRRFPKDYVNEFERNIKDLSQILNFPYDLQ